MATDLQLMPIEMRLLSAKLQKAAHERKIMPPNELFHISLLLDGWVEALQREPKIVDLTNVVVLRPRLIVEKSGIMQQTPPKP